ncbi:MCP four helix bundle domain-containing protein [Paludibacterium denitrificans]|uniref:Chemotaxis methyl-accepting receptor HlyB-like 4HB MCP domain-containing protein n=1 Tax=Paludibacterium denitrificans TaxID=2675226 RepID=A0A844GCY3_9NEIS|nr:MCP four helix bundle domain-containing protein [Paludibacterium denitrificans]MTD33200.1 hypothetical protein [Paludibacterium denitrificans]
MSIAHRITLTLLIALLALVGIGGYGIWAIGAAQDRFEFLQSNVTPSIKLLIDARSAVSNTRVQVRNHLIVSSPADKEKLKQSIAELKAKFDKKTAEYEPLVMSPEDKRLLEQEKANMKLFEQRVDALLAKSYANDTEGARALLMSDDFNATAKALTKGLNDHIDYNFQLGEQLRKENAASYQRAKWTLISAVIVLLLIVAGRATSWRP